MIISDDERAILDAIPKHGGEARDVRVEGISPQKRSRLLAKMEEKGLVEREPNPHGPETPWWWVRLPAPDDEQRVDPPPTAKGTIYDRYSHGGKPMVTFECNGEVNEYGCAVGYLKAGEHNARRAWVPLHLLNKYPWWGYRKRGEVTTWSSQFYCTVHGECTVEMVRTDKCCALCGAMLVRGEPTV